MAIQFPNIPQNLRVPLFYADIDSSRANTGQINQRALIIGQMTAAGSGVPDKPVIFQGINQAKIAGGQGSMLALMAAAYRARDSFGEVWYLPLADDGSAVAATGAINFTAAASVTGVLSLYIAAFAGSPVVSLVCKAAMSPAQLATALTAQINSLPDLPVTAEVDDSMTSRVIVTAKNKGLAGNEIDIRLNYYGAPNGEVMPPGLAGTITPMSGGQVNPTLTTALANLGDMTFDFIAMPYTDATSLDAMKSLLSTTTGRWSWSQQLYGHAYGAFRGTLGACQSFGASRNDEHMSIMAFNDSPTPAWILAADLTAASAVSCRADPAQPMQTVALASFLPPPNKRPKFPAKEETALNTRLI